MAIIEGIRIQNYRVLKDVTLGRLSGVRDVLPLTPLTTVIGKNGVGKSSLFDAFGFLADCLKLGVEGACDERGRGGFDRIRSKESNEPITFVVCYRRPAPASQLLIYILQIEEDDYSRPYVSREMLVQEQIEQNSISRPVLMMLQYGVGLAWKEYARGQEINETEDGGLDVEVLLTRLNEMPSETPITSIDGK